MDTFCLFMCTDFEKKWGRLVWPLTVSHLGSMRRLTLHVASGIKGMQVWFVLSLVCYQVPSCIWHCMKRFLFPPSVSIWSLTKVQVKQWKPSQIHAPLLCNNSSSLRVLLQCVVYSQPVIHLLSRPTCFQRTLKILNIIGASTWEPCATVKEVSYSNALGVRGPELKI